MAKIERGYFGPSESFLALTEDFIEAMKKACIARKIPLSITRLPNGVVRFLVDNVEVHDHHNDGFTATMRFVGIKQ